MSKIVQEFREFVARGNVIDLAVGIIIGAAFGKIVNSLVNDVIMPPVGLLLKKVNFKDLFWALDGAEYASIDAAKAKGAPIITYGAFINTVLEFFIVAVCVFLLVKVVNRIKRTQAAAPTPLSRSEVLLAEIADSLKKK